MQKTIILIFFILSIFTHTHLFSKTWECRNSLEISCEKEKCQVEKTGDFTPMHLYFDEKGWVKYCAYSGCWQTKKAQLKINKKLTALLTWKAKRIQNTQWQEYSTIDLMILFNKTDLSGVLKSGDLINPFFCKETKNNTHRSSYRESNSLSHSKKEDSARNNNS